jgi:hypothetical protein
MNDTDVDLRGQNITSEFFFFFEVRNKKKKKTEYSYHNFGHSQSSYLLFKALRFRGWILSPKRLSFK